MWHSLSQNLNLNADNNNYQLAAA